MSAIPPNAEDPYTVIIETQQWVSDFMDQQPTPRYTPAAAQVQGMAVGTTERPTAWAPVPPAGA